MEICKEFVFDAAHKLPKHKGKCKNLHGHTYKVQVCVEGEVGDDGMVIDFGILDKIVQELVIDKFDHSYLNNMMETPTAENLATWIWFVVGGEIKKNFVFHSSMCRVKSVTVWETPTSFARYYGEGMINEVIEC